MGNRKPQSCQSRFGAQAMRSRPDMTIGMELLLHWRRRFIAGQLDVAEQVVIERRIGEDCDGFGNVLTRGLDWDVIVLSKLMPVCCFARVIGHAKQFALDTWVGRAMLHACRQSTCRRRSSGKPPPAPPKPPRAS